MSDERTDAPTRIDDALTLLPRAIEPARDLWPGIEAQLEPRRTPGPRRWLWPAVAAMLLVAVSSLITAQLVRRAEQVAERRVLTVPEITFAAADFGPGQRLGPEFDAARQELARTLSARVARLPPEARVQLERNLRELRRASAEINAALALSPGDPLLEELLLNTYQDELAVLANVNQLTGGNGAATNNDSTRMQL
jgi:hypothetical protein